MQTIKFCYIFMLYFFLNVWITRIMMLLNLCITNKQTSWFCQKNLNIVADHVNECYWLCVSISCISCSYLCIVPNNFKFEFEVFKIIIRELFQIILEKYIYIYIWSKKWWWWWGQQLVKKWEEHGWYNSENIASCHRTNIFGSLWCSRHFCPFFFMQMMLLLTNYHFKKK